MSLGDHPFGQSIVLSLINGLNDRIVCSVCLEDLSQPKTCMNCKASFCGRCINVTSTINKYVYI